jgi:hypothetical protein
MYLDVLYGTQARIIIYEPKLMKNCKDRTASWVQINGRQKVGRADGIGVGSFVSPSYSGDSFARFHVYWVIPNCFIIWMLIFNDQ